MLLCCQRMLLMWHSTALQGKREVPVLKFCNQSITARQQSATHHRKLMYPLGPWGFAQVLNQTLSNTMWMWNKAILIMSWLLGTKKGPTCITLYLPWRSLWSLYLKFLQFSVTFCMKHLIILHCWRLEYLYFLFYSSLKGWKNFRRTDKRWVFWV